MCGIVGYIGKKPAFPILLSGLKRVLYRGYDSFGLSIQNEKNEITYFKTPGRVDDWEEKLTQMNFKGNLGIAHCLPPDTLVQMADGRTLEISKIKNGDKVLSVNPKTLKFEEGKVKVFKHKSPRHLYYLRTSFSDLKCTSEHKMFVFSEGKIIEKKAEEINQDDKLIIPQRIKVKGKKIKFKEIFVKRYYKLTEKAHQLIKIKLIKNDLSQQKTAVSVGVSSAYINHVIRNDRNFREDQLQKIFPTFSLKLSPEYCLPQSTIHGKFIKLPKESSPELMQILGYFLGDGNLQEKPIRFKDEDKELLKIYKKLIERVFNIKGRVVPLTGTTAYLLEVNSTFLRNWLKENILLRKKEFLEEVARLPEKELASFLKGLFDAEGCVAINAEQVQIGITDEEIGKILPFLLLRLGIIPSFSRRKRQTSNWNDVYLTYLSSYFLFKNFSKIIDFSSKEKTKKLEFLIRKRVKRAIKKEIQNPDIIFQPILEIKKIKSDAGYLYDLDLTPHSNFFANGLLSHNSRWASHGSVTEVNSHPHFDCHKEIFLVHNGIIENYKELKEKLEKEGHKFNSECDTEVIAHLIEKFFNNNLEEAVRKALKLVKGTYGLAIISRDDPEKLVVARNSSPILIGLGNDEYIVASDPAAIIGRTKKVVYLADEEIAVLTPEKFFITDLEQNKKEKIIEEIEWDLEEAQKGGFPHFMLKEIFEAPEVIENAIRGRLVEKEGLAKLGGLETIEEKLREIKNLIIIACGTSYFAGLVGEYMIEEYGGVPTEVEYGSEFRYRKPILNKKTAILAISQSGETADTLASLREAKRKGVPSLGIVNVIGSSLAREVEAGIYNHAGPEIGVASTKTFISQLAILTLLALFLGRQRQLSQVMGQRIAKELKEVPLKIRKILDQASQIEKLAKKYQKYNNFLFLGRKYNFPVALEGALKLKEISYIHAEGYGAGEMKHGPIALIDENFPTVAICPQDSVYEKMISNIEEIKARKGKIIALTTEGNKKIKDLVDDVIYIPKTLEMLTPILNIIPLQLFAYHMGVLRGCDVDKPRNLAKSVTVE